MNLNLPRNLEDSLKARDSSSKKASAMWSTTVELQTQMTTINNCDGRSDSVKLCRTESDQVPEAETQFSQVDDVGNGTDLTFGEIMPDVPMEGSTPKDLATNHSIVRLTNISSAKIQNASIKDETNPVSHFLNSRQSYPTLLSCPQQPKMRNSNSLLDAPSKTIQKLTLDDVMTSSYNRPTTSQISTTSSILGVYPNLSLQISNTSVSNSVNFERGSAYQVLRRIKAMSWETKVTTKERTGKLANIFLDGPLDVTLPPISPADLYKMLRMVIISAMLSVTIFVFLALSYKYRVQRWFGVIRDGPIMGCPWFALMSSTFLALGTDRHDKRKKLLIINFTFVYIIITIVFIFVWWLNMHRLAHVGLVFLWIDLNNILPVGDSEKRIADKGLSVQVDISSTNCHVCNLLLFTAGIVLQYEHRGCNDMLYSYPACLPCGEGLWPTDCQNDAEGHG